MTLPNTWVDRSGSTIQRPAGMSDAAWRAVLEGEGWTPGATSGAGSPAPQTPQQVMALVFQAIQGGAQVISQIHGQVTGANPAQGTVTLANGQTVPISSLGTVTAPNLNVTPSAPMFGGLGAAGLLAVGGALLVLLVVLKK